MMEIAVEDMDEEGELLSEAARRDRIRALLTPITDEGAASLPLVTREQIETALREASGGIRYPRHLPGGRYL